ncbi:MAG: hypothetical protein A2Z96_04355 [Spirochaetes bacterium GWB1_48_6]|nr:MAG: hypothetical protein A2Z96_04355 [Spirochaetes bacterium GWB1_48_6]
MQKSVFLGLLCFFFLLGCATTPSEINTNPDFYKNGSFTIAGTVEQSITLPGTTLSVFILGDGKSSLAAISMNRRLKGESVRFPAQLISLGSGPSALGPEEKALLLALLKKHKIVAEPFLNITLSGIEGALNTLGAVVKRLYFVLEE